MAQIKLDTKDLEEFSKALKREGGELHRNLYGAMQASALEIQSTSKKPGYVPYKTGNLRRSITHRLKSSSGRISAIFGSNLDYAAIHEFGGNAGRNGSVKIKAKKYIQRAIGDNTKNARERIIKAIALRGFK